MPRRLPVALLLTALVAGGTAVPAGAAPKIPSVPGGSIGNNTRITYKARIDVSMKVEVKEVFESIEKCVPGENGSVDYTFNYESDKPGGVKGPTAAEINLINGVGGTSKASRGEPGGAQETGKPGKWEFSLDDCNDSTDIQLPKGVSSPTCKPISGRVDTFLNTDVPSGTEDPDDLAPLATGGVLIVHRRGGGVQNLPCLRMFQRVESSDKIFDFDLAATATSTGSPVNQVFAIKMPKLSKTLMDVAGKKAVGYRSFKVTGPCYATKGTSLGLGPTFGVPRYETCSVGGSGVLTIRRVGAVSKLKF